MSKSVFEYFLTVLYKMKETVILNQLEGCFLVICLSIATLVLKNKGQWSHLWTLEGMIPWTLALCLLNSKILQISCWHTSHFTLSCMFVTCDFNLPFVRNFRVQFSNLHWNFGSVSPCLFRIWYLKKVKFLSHIGHCCTIFFFFLTCTLYLWLFSLWLSMKMLGHTSQINFSLPIYSGGNPPCFDS